MASNNLFDVASDEDQIKIPQPQFDHSVEKPPKPATPEPHIAIDVEVDYFTSDDGDIISHDHNLNNDGEALHRFILTHAASPPAYAVQLCGTHNETRTRTAYRQVNGRPSPTSSFSIDLTPHVVLGPTHWSLPDSDPAYRGLMVRQTQHGESRSKASKEQIDLFKIWEHERALKGIPPWVSRDGIDTTTVLKSSKTFRQWIDEYCASRKILKEFIYEKVIHGWDVQAVENALRDKIKETQYRGVVEIAFTMTGTKICIRPDNRLSRLLSNLFYKVLLMLILVYPFIWLFKRYNRRGGGRWEVCGGAYAMKHVEPLKEDILPASESPSAEAPSPRIVDTPDGRVRLTGLSEGEWFRRWEEVIKRAVVVGTKRPLDEPMSNPGDGPVDMAQALWGYSLPGTGTNL
ncbi:hypothetical protein BD779DRAFT_1485467 [Infundibulicybe gibba]|nr:hypothetical protein BD779DRAFT_1485467 [Infundibulicybe gibba]